MARHVFGSFRVVEEPVSGLAQHGTTSIAFLVESVFDVHEQETGSIELVERAIDQPYWKDYDAVEHPREWAARFDVGNWGLVGAYRDDLRVGGAAIAFTTPGLELLEGRSDLALLWDLRVAPEERRQGTGRLLFMAAEAWARARGGVELKVETQNTNVPACRFYERMGCELRGIRRGAYRAFPDEVQLFWYKHLR